MAVKSFTIYEEYFDLISLLDIEEQKDLLLAITEYMFKDKKPTLNDKQMKIFKNLKRPLDKSKNKSKSTSKQNQIEIKLKSNQNQNEIKTKTHQDVNVNVYVNKIIDYIENNLGLTINGTNYQKIEQLQKKYNDEILCYAVDKTIASGHRTLNYFFGIVNNWLQDGYKNLEEIKKNERKNKKVVPEWVNQEITSSEVDDTDFKTFVEDFRK